MREVETERDGKGMQAGLWQTVRLKNHTTEPWSGKTGSLSLRRLPLPHGTDPEARPSPTGASARLCRLTLISAMHSVHSQSGCLLIAP